MLFTYYHLKTIIALEKWKDAIYQEHLVSPSHRRYKPRGSQEKGRERKYTHMLDILVMDARKDQGEVLLLHRLGKVKQQRKMS